MDSPSLFHRIETSTRKRQSWAPVGFLYDLMFAANFCFKQPSRLGYLITPPYPVSIEDRATLQ